MTLVEIAVVVVIITILAVVGFVGYRRYRAAAYMSEATNMLGNIRVAENAYRAESGVYANVSNGPTAFYPNASPGPLKTQWGGPCGNCPNADSWEKMAIRSPGPVLFGYSTVAGIGAVPTLGITSLPPEIDATFATLSAKIGALDPYYVAIAQGDHNGDGVFCTVIGLSHSNELLIANSGE